MAKSQEELSKLKHIPVQVFEDKELVSNVTHHKYNPKFELVPEDQEMALLTELSLRRKDQIGTISINDPPIKYYDWPLNNIVKIKRNNLVQETLTPRTIYYRLIVSD